MSKPATKTLTASKKTAAKPAPAKKSITMNIATGDVKINGKSIKDKPATKDNTVGKTVRKADPAAFHARKIAHGAVVHVINETARPSSGQKLFAHTHAALTALGLLEPARPAIPTGYVLTLMGQRALTYHTKKQNFESAPNHAVRLTVTGRNWFTSRFNEGKVDVNLANAFMSLFLEGKAAPQTGVAQANVYTTKLGA